LFDLWAFRPLKKKKKQDVVGYLEVDYGPEENAHGLFKSYGLVGFYGFLS
jgi:hypothetical protein